jgi:hypothetical protein
MQSVPALIACNWFLELLKCFSVPSKVPSCKDTPGEVTKKFISTCSSQYAIAGAYASPIVVFLFWKAYGNS